MAWEWTEVSRVNVAIYNVTATDSITGQQISFKVDKANVTPVAIVQSLQDRVTALQSLDNERGILLDLLTNNVDISGVA